MTNIEIINALNTIGGIRNTSHVAMYECTRSKKDGGNHQVIVEIHDSGDKASPDTRYSVNARDADNPEICASGNDQPDVRTALAVVHWGDLG